MNNQSTRLNKAEAIAKSLGKARDPAHVARLLRMAQEAGASPTVLVKQGAPLEIPGYQFKDGLYRRRAEMACGSTATPTLVELAADVYEALRSRPPLDADQRYEGWKFGGTNVTSKERRITRAYSKITGAPLPERVRFVRNALPVTKATLLQAPTKGRWDTNVPQELMSSAATAAATLREPFLGRPANEHAGAPESSWLGDELGATPIAIRREYLSRVEHKDLPVRSTSHDDPAKRKAMQRAALCIDLVFALSTDGAEAFLPDGKPDREFLEETYRNNGIGCEDNIVPVAGLLLAAKTVRLSV